MDHHAQAGFDGLNKESNRAAGTQKPSALPQNGIHTSGDDVHVAKDMKHPTSLTNGASQPDSTKRADALPSHTKEHENKGEADRSPPQLEQWTHTYTPMGTLIERLAQQCFFDLQETIDGMADIRIDAAPSTNGAGPGGSHAAVDSSEASVEKKRRLMNFAQEQKDRFIKALVLSDWARNMDDMNQLIELRMWLQQQDDASSTVADAIMRLKHNMIPAKMPNPNIDGALKLLATGKAPWVPDMGYVPPKPLSAEQLLKAMRDMNFALSVRLNLHEQLPACFSNYTIANGRATFVVPDEFQVDLAVTDDEPESPFYFIDIRFLFSAAPQLPDGVMRSSLEMKVNEVLASSGLSGCFSFLHDFVLTHKVNLLRRQAQDMLRSRWNDCIRIEPIHRSVVLQYWIGQPGAKSWIEIGVASGSKTKRSKDRMSDQPKLRVRWFRDGQEVPEVPFAIDTSDPSMELLLQQVIASHTSWRLNKVNERLLFLRSAQSTLQTELHLSATEASSCLLRLRLGPSTQALTLRITPTTGSISISPVNAYSIDIEQRLNSDPSLDAGQLLTYLQCRLLQNHIGQHAQVVGWTPAALDKQDNLKAIFGADFVRRSTFTRPEWGTDWAIAVTIGLGGQKWWVVRIDQHGVSRAIERAEPLTEQPITEAIDRNFLLDIESRAVAQACLSNIISQLRQSNIRYALQKAPPAQTMDDEQQSLSNIVLTINAADLAMPTMKEPRDKWKSPYLDVLTLTHHGNVGSPDGQVKIMSVVKAVLDKHTATNMISSVRPHAVEDDDVTISETGTCALRMYTNWGQDIVPMLRSRLRLIERLASYIRILREKHAQLISASVSRLVFKYHTEPALLAEIVFPADAGETIKLRFLSDRDEGGAAENPHRRLQPILQRMLNAADPKHPDESDSAREARQFKWLLNYLSISLPALSAVSKIESAESSRVAVKPWFRGLRSLKLVWDTPLPKLGLDLELRRRGGREEWSVRVAKNMRIESEQVRTSLRALLGSSGEDWFGMTNTFVAGTQGIADVLERIDEAVRAARVDTEDKQSAAEGAGHEVIMLD